MAAALFLVSESVLAAVRSDFAEVAVINGTAQQTDALTPYLPRSSNDDKRAPRAPDGHQ